SGRKRPLKPRFHPGRGGQFSQYRFRPERFDAWGGWPHGFGRTSNTPRDRRKQMSNSMKKFTCPRMTESASVLAQAQARRTGGKLSTTADSTTTRASTKARLPDNSTGRVCLSQSNPNWTPSEYGRTLIAAP